MTCAKGTDTYGPRPFDEILWPETSTPLPIPSWNGFRDIWKRRCPTIRIRNVCEDTCPECYILKNRFRFTGGNNNDDNNNAPNEAEPDDGDSNNNDDDISLPSINDGSDKDEDYPYEQLIAEANQHAEEAQQQRALAKIRQQTAIDEADLPHEDRRFVFCFLFSSVLFYIANLNFFSPVIASFVITRRILSCLISGQSSLKTYITSRRSPSTFLGLPT